MRMYQFCGNVVKLILSIFGRITVFDKEKLPEKKGYVIACTHTGWIDILWLGSALLPKEIHYMAKKELFDMPILGWLIKRLNAFPVDRENPGPSAIKQPRRLIKDDKIVGIFPSGTRTSEDVPLKRGAVTIASYAKAPIVPAAYVGPNNFKELFTLKKARLILGDPIYIREDLPRREALEEMSVQLDKAMRQLQQRIQASEVF